MIEPDLTHYFVDAGPLRTVSFAWTERLAYRNLLRPQLHLKNCEPSSHAMRQLQRYRLLVPLEPSPSEVSDNIVSSQLLPRISSGLWDLALHLGVSRKRSPDSPRFDLRSTFRTMHKVHLREGVRCGI